MHPLDYLLPIVSGVPSFIDKNLKQFQEGYGIHFLRDTRQWRSCKMFICALIIPFIVLLKWNTALA